MIRPPPAGTPAQSVRTSAPQADLITNSTSRGRIGRSTNGGAAAAAAGAAVGLALALAGAVLLAAAGAARPPPAAATAFSHAAESPALFCSKHRRAAAPPVGTPAQTIG